MSRSTHIIDITDQADLDTRIAAGPVLLDLWAPWCGPCRTIAPIIDTLAEEYADRMTVIAANVDEAPAIAERYGVRSIPTIIYFPGGDAVPRRMTGVADAGRLRAVLELPA
jgi:thioredoxin 1